MKKRLMVDIECFAHLSQIGACYFSIKDDGKTLAEEQFIVNVSIESCLKHGLKVSAKELKFWLRQEGIPDWLEEPVSLSQALGRFREFCRRDTEVWSHNYDVNKLEEAYDAIGERIPFPYRNWRDIRTLMALYPKGHKTGKRGGEGDPKTHNALEDCLYQVKYVSRALKTWEGR